MTALHMAAAAGQEQVAKALLTSGASTFMYNSYGRTPLHEACISGRAGVVRVLLEGDADPFATVCEQGLRSKEIGKAPRSKEIGQTPLELANSRGHGHLSSYFLESELLEEANPMTQVPRRKTRNLNERPHAWAEPASSKGKRRSFSDVKEQPHAWVQPATAKGKWRSFTD